MFLVITGLAQESRIAAGPGVSHVVCSGSDPGHLRTQLSRLDSTGLRAVISFGIAGGLIPAASGRRGGHRGGGAGVWKVPPAW